MWRISPAHSPGVLALQAKQCFEALFHFSTRVYAHLRELEERTAGRKPTSSA